MDRQVVVVGGGFGGVHAALKLANQPGIAVRLIAAQSYFEYHAALYRSATGRSPLEVAIPLAEFFGFAKNVEVVEDSLQELDSSRQAIIGSSGSTYHYDELILALGNSTAFYGVKGLAEHAYGVKTIQEALRLKRHLHEQLTQHEAERAYVVIGGGATGVELAAELLSYLRSVRRQHKIKRDFKVYLVEASPRVLANMPEGFSAKVERRLKELGVQLIVDSPVRSETAEAIKLPDETIATHTVIWTAGVTNNPFFEASGQFEQGKLGRVVVNHFLEGAPNVYVVGDAADTQFSGMAQTALHDSAFVSDNLLRRHCGQAPLSYRPKRPIYAIPVGNRWSAVRWGGVEIYGFPGWLLRRLADLRLYLRFLPLKKALTTWRYGFVQDEVCSVCKH